MSGENRLDTIKQGNHRDVLVTVGGKNPIDITNATVNFILKTLPTDPDGSALIDLTNGIGDHEVGLGQTIFRLTGVLTNITPTDYHYEVTYVSQASEKATLVRGRVRIEKPLKDPS